MSTSQNTADTIVYLLNTDAIQKTGNYCLALNGDMKREMLENQAENAKLFHDEQGVLRIDIELEEMHLSVRSYNALKNSGYIYASQLIGMTVENLLSIKNLGANSASEILDKMERLSYVEAITTHSSYSENISCSAFVSELGSHLEIHRGHVYEKLVPLFDNYDNIGSLAFSQKVFSIDILRNAIKGKVFDLVFNSPFGRKKSEVMTLFPEGIIVYDILQEIIYEMEAENQIIIGDKIEYRRMTIWEYAKSIQDEREKKFLLEYLDGKTYEEIGRKRESENSKKISRERVRQVIAKPLKRKPLVVEDKYREVFEKYNFTRKDFSLAFGENDIVYNYLNLICNKHGDGQIEQLLEDEIFPIEIRKKAERVVYKNYITVGNERVYKSRPDFADYIARTYFQEESLFEDFIEYYNMFLVDFGLSSDESFIIGARTYENRFASHDKIVWKQGKKFRYYDFANYDFMELLQELSLEQYKDVEYSTLKFFKDNGILMKRYDIRDEYELHNILKKVCSKENMFNIKFGRMPMIEFGNANRDEQVLDTLIRVAPISRTDFEALYESEYGIKPAVFTANHTKNFKEYYHNGMYDISIPPLLPEQFKQMSNLLTEDYYEISDVKRLYQRMFPNYPVDNINPYTLKTMEFNVFASYIVKNKYGNAVDYFRHLLTTDDLVNSDTFPIGVTNKIAYTTELSRLKSTYEIVEYEPYRYVNISRLVSTGITIERIDDYCAAVARCVEHGEYFTITSLGKKEFSHELDDLGFSEVFYSSLLTEKNELFSYQRMARTKVFRKGKTEVSLTNFLRYIIEKEQSVDIYELVEFLDDYYGAHFERHKIIEVVKNSSMYYDLIMEKVYIDYDTYFEEV